MIQKQNYVAPAAECMEVSLEKRFLTDSDQLTTNGSSFGEQGNVTNVNDGMWHWMN